LSPCVLPLIPSYLFFIGGSAAGRSAAAGGKDSRWRTFFLTCFFTLGFSAVFIALSVIFSTVMTFFNFRYIDIIAGVIIIILGLNIIFDFLKFLNYEKRFSLTGGKTGPVAAFLTGAAFGAGWTPCVGPILASILLLAGQSGSLPLAVLYLLLYSAGFALPFLAASLFFDRFLAGAAIIKKHIRLIHIISGILLVVTGILILSGRFAALNRILQRLTLPGKWESAIL